MGPVAIDAEGNIYGSTLKGGENDAGLVYLLQPKRDGSYQEWRIYQFAPNGPAGMSPGPLVEDAWGNLLGVSTAGVFELTRQARGVWSASVLYSNYSALSVPLTISNGSVYDPDVIVGHNLTDIVEFVPNGNGYTAQVLYKLQDWHWIGAIAVDGAGDIFGAANYKFNTGVAAVLELTPSGGTYTVNILHTFGGPGDGSQPNGITMDAAGNVYGTTAYGGSYNDGIVYELVPGTQGYTENILDNVGQNAPAYYPNSTPVLDSGGIFFTTASGNGTVVELVPNGNSYSEQVVHSFTGGMGGANPHGTLYLGRDRIVGVSGGGKTGDCYSTGCGTVYAVTP